MSTPPPVRLRPMTWDDLDTWLPRSVQGFADQQVAAGLLGPDEALLSAREVAARELPDGIATPLQHLWTVWTDDDHDAAVGFLWLRVRPLSDEVEAYVLDVLLDEQHRGRGLGRATMVAAEEAARELGATVMRLRVFGHNEVANRLYDALGYAETGATMSKRVGADAPGPPEPAPVGWELRAMTSAEFEQMRPALEASYAEDIERAGLLPPAEARQKAVDDLRRLLPDGLATPGHHLWSAYVDGHRVGHAWVHVEGEEGHRRAFGFDLLIAAEHRRRGYARTIMAQVERACADLGVTSLGLSVFGFNAGARSLYEQSGFTVADRTMVKGL